MLTFAFSFNSDNFYGISPTLCKPVGIIKCVLCEVIAIFQDKGTFEYIDTLFSIFEMEDVSLVALSAV